MKIKSSIRILLSINLSLYSFFFFSFSCPLLYILSILLWFVWILLYWLYSLPLLNHLHWDASCIFSSVQSLSSVRLFVTPWTAAWPSCPSPTPGIHPNPCTLSCDAIQPSHPLPSPLLLPSIFPSIRVFSSESALRIRWPKYWSFSFNISPSSEHPGLISFRMDWLDLFAVQGTLKSLLQHHSTLFTLIFS